MQNISIFTILDEVSASHFGAKANTSSYYFESPCGSHLLPKWLQPVVSGLDLLRPLLNIDAICTSESRINVDHKTNAGAIDPSRIMKEVLRGC